MSSGLSLNLLDLTATRALIGSGDGGILQVIRENFASQLAAADEYFAEEIAGGAPTAHEALHAVIHGGPFVEKHAFQYGYAFQRLCELTGHNLPNTCFSPFRGPWLSVVDEAMRGLGVTAVSVERFGESLPDPLPWTYVPQYGEWGPEQCAKGLAQWEASTEEQRRAVDPEVLDAVEQCVGWLRSAAQRPGFGIAGFLS